MSKVQACVLGALFAAGCGGAEAPAAPSATALNASALARNDLNGILAIMQANWINRHRINWTDFRAQVAV